MRKFRRPKKTKNNNRRPQPIGRRYSSDIDSGEYLYLLELQEQYDEDFLEWFKDYIELKDQIAKLPGFFKLYYTNSLNIESESDTDSSTTIYESDIESDVEIETVEPNTTEVQIEGEDINPFIFLAKKPPQLVTEYDEIIENTENVVVNNDDDWDYV